MRFRPPAISTGIRAWRATRPGQRRAQPWSRRRHAIPAATRLVDNSRRGRKGAGSSSVSLRSASSMRPDQGAPDLEIARIRGVDPVAVLKFERRPGPRRRVVLHREATPGRARQARRRPRRRRTARGPRRRLDRRPAQRVAGRGPSVARANSPQVRHRDAYEERVPADRRAGLPASRHREDRPPRVHAPRQ